MSDFKSKIPNIKELGSMANKLFNGVKSSVGEIIEDYKKNRGNVPPEKPAAKKTTTPKK